MVSKWTWESYFIYFIKHYNFIYTLSLKEKKYRPLAFKDFQINCCAEISLF